MPKWLLALPLMLLALPAVAQERSKQFERVVDCRKIAEAAERLACYDNSVAALEEAEQKKDVVIVDKEQVRQARKSVFGFALPKIKLFGEDKDEVDEVESTVAAFDTRSDGRAFFTIADGARWVQTDDRPLVGVRPGRKVTIRKGSMGSFFASFQGAIGIRVARVN